MHNIGKLFLQGMVVAIPVFLTVAILWWMAGTAENLLGGLISEMLPDGWYVPGMGLLSGVALILLIGVLSHVIVFQRLFQYAEAALGRVPLVKTIYTALKDFTAYLGPGHQQDFRRAVMVTIANGDGGAPLRLIGFVTREQFEDIGLPLDGADTIAVYLPMSYQIGGYTLYLPRQAVVPLDIPFEEAMRLALTGAVARQPRGDRR